MLNGICSNPTLYHMFCQMFNYQFMQNAFLAAIPLGVLTGVIGAFVVVRGMAFMSDALAHAVMPGVAVAYIQGGMRGPLMLGAIVAGALVALVIGFFTRGGKLREDTGIGVIFTGALALGLAILSLSQIPAKSMEDLLVGNILALGVDDVLIVMVIAIGVLLLVRFFYKEWLIISFDPVLGATLQYPVEGMRYLLLVALAITTVVALKVIGLVLIAAMLVTPAAAASLLVRRMHWVMFWGAVISVFSGVFGIFLSWNIENLSANAAIVLTATVIFFLVYFFAPRRGMVWMWISQRRA